MKPIGYSRTRWPSGKFSEESPHGMKNRNQNRPPMNEAEGDCPPDCHATSAGVSSRLQHLLPGCRPHGFVLSQKDDTTWQWSSADFDLHATQLPVIKQTRNAFFHKLFQALQSCQPITDIPDRVRWGDAARPDSIRHVLAGTVNMIFALAIT